MFNYLGGKEAEQFYEKANPRYIFNFFSCGEIFIPFAREQLAKTAIDTGCDYLFMVDDDMLAPHDLFYRLVAHNKDIIAPLAFTRNAPHNPVIYEFIQGYDPVVMSDYSVPNIVKNYPRNSLVQCDAVGFGAALINTRVLKAMPVPWFMGTPGTGEDIAFCAKAGKLGFETWMDTSVKLGHLSHPTIVTEEYSDNYNKLSQEEKDRVYGQFQKYPSLEESKCSTLK